MKISRDDFERLAMEQLDTLYRVAHRLTRNPSGAEDLVQETFLRALRARDGFDLQSFGIRPWLLRILHNLHITRSGRDQRQPATVEDGRLESASESHRAGAPLPIDPGSNDAMDERLVAALENLPSEYGTVMQLWAVEELSYKEIAEALEVPIGTVMSRLHRARQRLATELREYAREEGFLRGERSASRE